MKPAAPAATPDAKAANEAAIAQRKAEIETARARCTALLKTITAVATAKDTIEEGECGALAPIELSSVGKVALSPPAVVNCDMAVALHDWIKNDVQPLARKHLGKEITKLETMSSYSCRNAYGRVMNKLSEHGRANALDIRGFVTSAGQTAYVLNDWGMTSGEIRAAAAAAEKERAARELAAKADAEAKARALAAAASKSKSGSTGAGTAPNPLANAGTIADQAPTTTFSFSGSAVGGTTSGGFALAPSKLGGPKKPAAAPESAAVAPKLPAPTPHQPQANDNAVTATSLFLRAVHDSACKRFATTLGPETNAAHRNHFHVDLAERKSNKAICE